MQEYYFLFGLAFVWIIFASIQDLKTREISNWLNFSLVAFVLAYRAFYAIIFNNFSFFFYGVLGMTIFFAIALLFYYGRVFAGGDAKLLIGLGGIFPYQNIFDFLVYGLGFVIVLFFSGAVYTIIYSLFLIKRDAKKFVKEFKKETKKRKIWVYVSLILGGLLELVNYSVGVYSFGLSVLFLVLLPIVFIYAKSLDKSIMIKKVPASKLMEGDWLEKEVKIGKRLIKKSVHGLSEEEIKILRKAKKEVWIKDGVPFGPAFLIALVLFLWILGYTPFNFDYFF